MKLFEYFNSEPRWFSFENPDAKRGAAAKENHGAKGHAFEYFLREKPKCSRIFPEWELSAGSG